MISRIATAALAVMGGLSFAAAETAVQVHAAAVDPFALNTTSWMVSYQFLDDFCATDPFMGTAQPMGRCYVARGEEYASYLYVCNSEQGSGKLTYSGSNCEPDTFIEYTETVPVDYLDQCIGIFPVEVPQILGVLTDAVEAQMFQCTDDSIGYDLLHQPAEAEYNEKCPNGLKIAAYFRKTDCVAVDGGTSSMLVTCDKKDGFALEYYKWDDTCAGGSTYFSHDSAEQCHGINLDQDNRYWEYTTCDGSTIPDGGDAAFTTAAGFGWAMISAMALLALFARM